VPVVPQRHCLGAGIAGRLRGRHRSILREVIARMAADPVEIDGEIREILDFLESHKDNPDLLRRFVEEAQIGGQLQHPGIVPIYELGTFADHRPFFALKLVKGRTLASLLAERSDPARDLPRFLAIFESICQTMALLMPAA
jgi:serine/threonine protein kinase